MKTMLALREGALGAALLWALAGCASTPRSGDSQASPAGATPAAEPARPMAPAPVPEISPGVIAGYLGRGVPDSLKLLPAPPAAGSAAFRQDQAISRAAQKLRGTPR
jgi:acid phosphatase (class A)